MDRSEDRKATTPDEATLAEEALVDLLDEHREEAVTHELTHKGLLAEPHPPDHDRRHADPLKPSHHFTPDPHPAKRDIL